MSGNRTLNLGLLLLVSASMVSCAAMMESWRKTYCNYDGAFKAGMNDARSGKDMNMSFSGPCNPQSRPDVERGYREGYTRGVCAGQGAAGGPEHRCIEAYGKKACGYHCIQGYGEVRCASQPHHNCVQAYGKLACGQNCRSEHGQIVCD